MESESVAILFPRFSRHEAVCCRSPILLSIQGTSSSPSRSPAQPKVLFGPSGEAQLAAEAKAASEIEARESGPASCATVDDENEAAEANKSMDDKHDRRRSALKEVCALRVTGFSARSLMRPPKKFAPAVLEQR